MLASICWYAGLLFLAWASLGLIHPIRFLGLPTRRRAAAAGVVGLALATSSLVSGRETERISRPLTLMDRVFPAFQFREEHALEIQASAERTYRALFEVTPDDIAGYRTLTSIRCLGRCTGESILNPAGSRSLLETALRTSFRKLAERPNEELVFGGFVAAPSGALARTWTLEAFVALEEPGFAKTAMNFLLVPQGDRQTLLRTETRVYSTDAATRRLFTVYWRTIFPGSALIRREWLRAVKRRAE